MDTNFSYGLDISQTLRYAKMKFCNTVNLEEIQSTPDKSATGYVLEVDLNYTDKTRTLSLHFSFCPENKKTIQ